MMIYEQQMTLTYGSYVRQGCKRDFFFRDETETETFFEMSQTVQPVKLLASNFHRLCCVRSFITQNTVQYKQLFYRNFRALFPKTVSNLKNSSSDIV